MMEGRKDDQGKLSWYDLPLEMVELLVPVATAGRKKYGLHSALKPFENNNERWYNADMRHAVPSQIDPLAIDEEDGCYHLAKRAYNDLARLYHAIKDNAAPNASEHSTKHCDQLQNPELDES